jgi:phosphohistidine phosphatase
MKTLFLLRHAKSSWETEGQRDFDRPLNPRGIAGTALMAKHFITENIRPDAVFCSPAARTRETLQRLRSAEVNWPTDIIADDVYLASAETLMALVKSADDACQSLIIIGHNPGLEDLAFMLITKGDAKYRARLDEKFPTATVCEITFDIDQWAKLDKKSGTLAQFTRPRDLGFSVEEDD